MKRPYVHGYHPRENVRLQDQASTLVQLLHHDTVYPAGSRVLEAGCGVAAQTVTLATNSPDALITSVDISEVSIAEARKRAADAGLANVQFQQADIFDLPFASEFFDHVFICFVLEHLSQPEESLIALKRVLKKTEPSRSLREIMDPPISIRRVMLHKERFSVRLNCRNGPAAMP